MPLSTEVDLSPGHIVLDGDPAPPAKGAQQPPSFSPCLLWPWSPISATAELLLTSDSLFLVLRRMNEYCQLRKLADKQSIFGADFFIARVYKITISLPPPRKVMFLLLFVCLCVCLPPSNFAEKLPNRFS